ncbi:unnamed protein product [Cylicocyclus nassatus]|uniref:Uncharacterized protein n=1 Tax=Cylicocyclus nassatus TaxID=53992 RepID=A0AA36ME48_CYLNA|nr:unnamed protein product [Cylicocyclus nassatus]
MLSAAICILLATSAWTKKSPNYGDDPWQSRSAWNLKRQPRRAWPLPPGREVPTLPPVIRPLPETTQPPGSRPLPENPTRPRRSGGVSPVDRKQTAQTVFNFNSNINSINYGSLNIASGVLPRSQLFNHAMPQNPEINGQEKQQKGSKTNWTAEVKFPQLEAVLSQLSAFLSSWFKQQTTTKAQKTTTKAPKKITPKPDYTIEKFTPQQLDAFLSFLFKQQTTTKAQKTTK